MQQELLNQVGTMDLNNQHAGKITMMAMFRVSDSNKPWFCNQHFKVWSHLGTKLSIWQYSKNNQKTLAIPMQLAITLHTPLKLHYIILKSFVQQQEEREIGSYFGMFAIYQYTT